MTDSTPLAELLAARGIKSAWLASRVGVSPSYLSQITHGRRPLSQDLARRLAAELRVPIKALRGAGEAASRA